MVMVTPMPSQPLFAPLPPKTVINGSIAAPLHSAHTSPLMGHAQSYAGWPAQVHVQGAASSPAPVPTPAVLHSPGAYPGHLQSMPGPAGQQPPQMFHMMPGPPRGQQPGPLQQFMGPQMMSMQASMPMYIPGPPSQIQQPYTVAGYTPPAGGPGVITSCAPPIAVTVPQLHQPPAPHGVQKPQTQRRTRTKSRSKSSSSESREAVLTPPLSPSLNARRATRRKQSSSSASRPGVPSGPATISSTLPLSPSPSVSPALPSTSSTHSSALGAAGASSTPLSLESMQKKTGLFQKRLDCLDAHCQCLVNEIYSRLRDIEQRRNTAPMR